MTAPAPAEVAAVLERAAAFVERGINILVAIEFAADNRVDLFRLAYNALTARLRVPLLYRWDNESTQSEVVTALRDTAASLRAQVQA